LTGRKETSFYVFYTFSLSLLNTDLVLVELDEIFLASKDAVDVASFAEIVAAAALTAFVVGLATDKLRAKSTNDLQACKKMWQVVN
jgi:hypothetical protein